MKVRLRLNSGGAMMVTRCAQRLPPRPVMKPATDQASILVRATLTPIAPATTSLSRTARKASQKRDFCSRHSPKITAATTIGTVSHPDRSANPWNPSAPPR